MPEDLIVLDDELLEAIADLQIQSMMFDMSIDWETATLTEKIINNTPAWLAKWKEKEHGGDRTPEDYEGGE